MTEQVRATTDRIKHMGNLSNTSKQVNPATASTLFMRPKETGHSKVFNFNIQCVYCSQAHYSASCEQVKDNTERKNILLRDHRCFRCLKVGHREKDCRIRRNCLNCGLGHHQSICQRDQQPQTKNNCAVTGCASCQSSRAEKQVNLTLESPDNRKEKAGEHDRTGEQMFTVSGTVKSKNEVLLKTASVLAVGENSATTVPIRMLLDDGSQKSYITNSLKTELKLKNVKKQTVCLNTFGNDHYQKHALDVVKLKLKGQFNGYCNEIEVSALCVPEICMPLPASIDLEKYNYLQGYELADQYTHTTNFTERPINLLIGSDQYYDIVTGDTVKSITQKGPVAVSSIFGYLICGPTTDSPDDEMHVNSCLIVQCQHDPFIIEQHSDKLENTLKRFWESEETGVNSRSFIDKRIEDENTDEHENFLKDIRFVGNRYQVKLPWIDAESMPSLTGNYDLCKRRLNSLMFRLKKDPKLLEQYDDVFQEQLSLGIIE